MRILVTGATGFVGKNLVPKLKRHRVTVFARSEVKIRNVRIVKGDMKNREDLEKAFKNIDVVYHIAAVIHGNDVHSNIIGTQNIVALCRQYKVKQLIYMSSCGVFGKIREQKEDTPYAPETSYEKSKTESERIVIRSGISYTIIRSPAILGPTHTWLSVIKTAKKRYPIIGSGKNHFHVAYIDDVVRALVFALGNRKVLGKALHVATSDAPTYEEFYSMLCKELGISMTTHHIPVIIVRILGLLKEGIANSSNIKRITRDRIIFMNYTKKLGFSPKYSTRKALKETVKYFKNRNLV